MKDLILPVLGPAKSWEYQITALKEQNDRMNEQITALKEQNDRMNDEQLKIDQLMVFFIMFLPFVLLKDKLYNDSENERFDSASSSRTTKKTNRFSVI